MQYGAQVALGQLATISPAEPTLLVRRTLTLMPTRLEGGTRKIHQQVGMPEGLSDRR